MQARLIFAKMLYIIILILSQTFMEHIPMLGTAIDTGHIPREINYGLGP